MLFGAIGIIQGSAIHDGQIDQMHGFSWADNPEIKTTAGL
jgi:hypothetical protein